MKLQKNKQRIRASVRRASVVVIVILGGALFVMFAKRGNIPSSASLPDKATVVDGKTAVEVEVLDATGCTPCAFAIVQQLRAHGYDVVEFRKSGSAPIDASYLLVYGNSFEKAQAIAKSLFIDEKKIFRKPNTTTFVDISVVLGKDALKKNNTTRRMN